MTNKHQKMIYSIVWEIHRQSGIEWEELFAEALLTYFLKKGKFNRKRGMKSTFLFTCIRNRLQNFAKEERDNTFLQLEEAMNVSYTTVPFFELYDSLSKDSQVIVDLILEDPYEYVYVPSKIARGKIAKKLYNDLGWVHARVWDSFRKLKSELCSK